MIKLIKRILAQRKCVHKWHTVSNFYGDYINYISTGRKIYRSRIQCVKCGKCKLSEMLDKNCKVINDGHYRKGGAE